MARRGAKIKYSKRKMAAVCVLRRKGYKLDEIVQNTGIPVSTVCRILQRAGLMEKGKRRTKINVRCPDKYVGTPEHTSWHGMWQRCTDVQAGNYPQYGGRGVTVCERWWVFERFLEDMGLRSQGMTLDRIDPAGNYEPSNCRWASFSEQSANQRRYA